MNQSIWLVAICVAIYTLIPEESRTQQGWKVNLVTMETSMASGIAATYGYSVAGGIPGGLIAEYVMQNAGKRAVAELSPLLGPVASKAFVGFALFSVMGVFLEFCAICAYAYAHQARPQLGSPRELPGDAALLRPAVGVSASEALTPRAAGRGAPGGGEQPKEVGTRDHWHQD